MVFNLRMINMSDTLGYLCGELGKQNAKRKASLLRHVTEYDPVKKLLLAVYNKIFNRYTS